MNDPKNPLAGIAGATAFGAAVVSLLLCLAVPAVAQIEGGRSLSFSNITVGFGARAMALGGAFIAIADDVTAMAYNPAGLAQLLKPEFSVGEIFGGQTIKIPRADLSASMSPGYDYYFSSSSEINSHGFDFSYVGAVLPFKIGRLPVALGFAHQIKGSNINADYSYAYVDSFGVTDESTSYHVERYMTRFVTPSGTTKTETVSLAARPFEFLHLGINLNFWGGKENGIDSMQSAYDWYTGGAYVGRNTRVYETASDYRISRGTGWDAGLLVKAKAGSLGLVYKSGFTANYAYGYTVTDAWGGVPFWEDSFSSSGKLYWPETFGAGVAVRPLELLTVCVDYTATQWSKGRIERPGFVPMDYPVDDPQNTHQLRAGIEYILPTKRVVVPVRAGWFGDRLYWNDLAGKAVKFMGLTIGTGLVFKSFIVDMSGTIHFGSYLAAATDLNSTRRSSWSLFGSLTYRL